MPVSPLIVSVVATSASPAAVKRPKASTVKVGIFVAEPYDAAVTPVAGSSMLTAAVSEPEPVTVIVDPVDVSVAT